MKSNPPWKPGDVYIAVGGTLLLQLIALFLATAHEKWGTFSFLISPYPVINFTGAYLLTAFTFLFPLYIILRGKEISYSDFGIRKTTLWEIIRTILYGYGLLLLTALILAAVNYFIPIEDIPGLQPQSLSFLK